MTVAICVQAFVPFGAQSNSTLAIPEPESDADAAIGVDGPPIVFPGSGIVIEPVGAVLSIVTVRAALVPV